MRSLLFLMWTYACFWFIRTFYRDKKLVGTLQFARSLQWDDYSCGARSAYMIANHFGHRVPYTDVKEALDTNEKGTRVKPLLSFFRSLALRTRYSPQLGWHGLHQALAREGVVVVHLDGDHLGVVHGMSNRFVYLADPSIVRLKGRRMTRLDFNRRWSGWGITVRA